MDKDIIDNQDYKVNTASIFLDTVADQIAYQPVRKVILKELEEHIEDHVEEYLQQGLSRAEAETKAVFCMGDPVLVGTQINEVRCVRNNIPLLILSAVLMLAGFAATVYMYWSPEQQANGYLYYLPGCVMFILAAFKGYPLFVKYWRKILSVMAVEYLALIVFYLFRLTDLDIGYFFYPPLSVLVSGLLLLAPVLTLFLYSQRTKKNVLYLGLIATAAAIGITFFLINWFLLAAIAVFFLSLAGTILYMIGKGIFSGKKSVLFMKAAAGILLLSILFVSLPGQKYNFKVFTKPSTAARDTWADAYNGVLIQELLSRTPFFNGLTLSPEEMMEYGTGRWYFNEIGEIQEDGSIYLAGDHLRYIHYDETDVSLWDILPQHYHNNYLIAVGIFLYGWWFGVVCLLVLVAFFSVLYHCISNIRGELAGSLAVCCSLCMFMQAMFYVLGNFGYQYAWFTNLPLVSEGRISILVNTLLLGLVFSAYRYDRVVDESHSCVMIL